MTEDSTTRRRFLMLAGTTATIGIAGCSTEAAGPDDSDGSEPTETSAPTTSTPTDTPHSETSGDSHDEGAHDEGGHDEGGHDEDTETTVHEQEDEHGGHGHGRAVGDPVEHAEVKMVTGDHGYHFEPHIVRVKKGGTVTFHNESGSHSAATYHPDNGKQLRIPDGAEAWDSGLLSEQGATFEVTLDVEGIYDVYCAPHETLGMIGSIIVGEPDAHGQPGLSEPSKDMPEKVRTKIAELNKNANEALGHTH